MTNINWASTAPFTPFGLTVAGNSLYATYVSLLNSEINGGQLEQISLTNPTNANAVNIYPPPTPPATKSTTPFFLATDNTYIYITTINKTIDRYNIATGMTLTGWYTLTDPTYTSLGSSTVVGSKLYFWQSTSDTQIFDIYAIDLLAPTVTATLFYNVANVISVSGLSVFSLTTDGSYLYFPAVVSNGPTGAISSIARLNINNTNNFLPQWYNTGTFPTLQSTLIPVGLNVFAGYLYINIIEYYKIAFQQPGNSSIVKISLTNPSGDSNLTWQQYVGGGYSLTNDGTYLYVANLLQKTISRFALGTASATALSNICFPAGTPIKTDQGFIPIEQLQPGTHTISKKPIEHITQTMTLDKYLISFQPSSLGYNVPNQKTLMSKDHKIAFNGQLVPAYRFLDYSDKVKKVKYSGEVLYNVLLAEHGLMEVNKLQCETLHPENVIAKLYKSPYTPTERTQFICLLNDSLQKRDLATYKSLINKF